MYERFKSRRVSCFFIVFILASFIRLVLSVYVFFACLIRFFCYKIPPMEFCVPDNITEFFSILILIRSTTFSISAIVRRASTPRLTLILWEKRHLFSSSCSQCTLFAHLHLSCVSLVTCKKSIIIKLSRLLITTSHTLTNLNTLNF